MAVHEADRQIKRELRRELLARRAQRSPADRERAADALCARVSSIPEVASATRVACYASLPQEPGTHPLLSALSARGCQVLLPILQPDLDLGWAVYRSGALHTARLGISEPDDASLGVDAVRRASVVICPALAVNLQGHRLGRGGGCYDRVLGRLAGTVLAVALLYDDEVLDAVPTEEHDQQVDLIVTPSRTLTAWSRADSG